MAFASLTYIVHIIAIRSFRINLILTMKFFFKIDNLVCAIICIFAILIYFIEGNEKNEFAEIDVIVIFLSYLSF
jgi:hypothetical protein